MRESLNACLDELESVVNACPWENKGFYADYLAQTFHYVCHSTRLLGLAASYFQLDRDALHRRFADHMGEEKSHERLALQDLKQLGSEITQWDEHPLTRAFYECQYCKIERQDACALFGYILFLEGMAVRLGPVAYGRVVKAHGPNAAKFLKLHVEEDPDHVERALAQLLQLPPASLTLIRANLEQSATVYKLLLENLAQKHVGRQLTAKAS